MKKILALFLTAALSLSLAACSSGGNSTQVTPDNLLGEWYDVQTSGKLLLNSDNTLQTSGLLLSQPGRWELSGNEIQFNTLAFHGDEVFSVDNANGTLSIVSENYNFKRWNDLPSEKLTIGETGKDNVLSLTLDNVSFSPSLPEKVLNSTSYMIGFGKVKKDALESGQICAKITYTLTNNSQAEILIGTISGGKLDIFLNYKDGYMFSTKSENTSYFISDDDMSSLTGERSSSGQISVQPLQTRTIDTYIVCSEDVAKDISGSLNVTFISRYDSEAKYYDYSVR